MKYEHRLPKFGIAKRRGVFATWGNDWSSCLLQYDDGDIVPELAKCRCVASIQEVTDSVFDGSWRPPPSGGWSLLVSHKHQRWHTLASALLYNEDCDRIAEDFSGKLLRTGHRDDIVYVRLWEAGRQILEFVTDGCGFPMPPEDIDPDDEIDYRSIYDFHSELYDNDFPHMFETVEEAHQQLIIDQDAYVAGIIFEDGSRDGSYALGAGYRHDAAVDRKNITAVHAITFTDSPQRSLWNL